MTRGMRLFCAVVLTVCCLRHASGQHTPAKAQDEWPAYGGTLAGQRFSTSNQINTANVQQLRPAWVMHTHALDKPSPNSNWRSSFEVTPVLWNNTLYFDTAFDQVFAVNAATGEVKWSFDPLVNREGPIYIVTSRGVSLWHAAHPRKGVCGRDTVILATLDRRMIARDAETGAACPQFGTNGAVDLSKGVTVAVPGLYGFTSPATIVNDTIVLGSSVADNQTTFAASGAVRGFDAVTGRQKWSWDPLAQTGLSTKTGSGNAWAVMAADPEHDLVYVPTGSASSDFFGGTRPGDNRDADSIVALRASTGQRVWGFQFVHHDLWDYDTPSEPLLFTFRGRVPAVAVVTKTSMVFVFNRLTGEPLYPIQERPVPASTLPGETAWPTQPYSTLPTLTPLTLRTSDLHLHNPEDQKFCTDLLKDSVNEGLFTPPSAKGSVLYPGSLGGANWGSAALDPRTGTMYVRVSTLPFFAREQVRPDHDFSGSDLIERIRRNLPEWAGGPPPPLKLKFKSPDSGGEQRDESPQKGTPYTLGRQGLMTPSGIPCAPEPFGSIVALNLNSGQKVWTAAHGEMVPGYKGSIGDGGVIATAGGLVFAASTNDAFLRAYDAASGRELWKGTLPAVGEATPMSYTANGRQYVVTAAGGHGFIGEGKSDALVAFALPQDKSAKARDTTAKHSVASRKR